MHHLELFFILVFLVIYAYDQALLSLGYHADIWYESACFHEKIVHELKERGDIKVAETIEQETSKLYNRATSGLMKDTPLIHFAHADFEEAKQNYDLAKSIYDKLINFENSDPTLVSYCNMLYKLNNFYFFRLTLC